MKSKLIPGGIYNLKYNRFAEQSIVLKQIDNKVLILDLNLIAVFQFLNKKELIEKEISKNLLFIDRRFFSEIEITDEMIEGYLGQIKEETLEALKLYAEDKYTNFK